MEGHFVLPEIKSDTCSVRLSFVLGLGLPVVVTLYFYVWYASNAWFFQDDFGFIFDYANSIQWSQLFDFTNFGRFLSRNGYWYLGIKYFSLSAQFFYLINLCIIFCSCFLLYKIFVKNGWFNGFVAGFFYFTLPATIESYSWLSNSQHILGHFFVILFVYLFTKDDVARSRSQEFAHAMRLGIVLILGFASNIFMSMVLSLPVWAILTNKQYRRSKSAYFSLLFGILLFALFFFKLSGNQKGAYSTSYTTETFVRNLEFYFMSGFFAAIWGISVVTGAMYALARKNYFASWLFLASAAFFLPFAFFVHQRYGQYGALTYLFFLLGIWSLLIESRLNRLTCLVNYAGLIMVLFVFSKSLGQIRYLSENPRGADQKQQVRFLKVFNAQNPNIKNYCFRSSKEVGNTTDVEVWDIPADWWFVGFGKAFYLFVSQENKYELIRNSEQCEVVFVFRDGQLESISKR